MKANEVMTGDWVYFHNGTAVEPRQVTGVLIPDCIYLDFGYEPHTNLHTISLIEPIPLSSEILEKNGFTCDANGMNDSDEPTVSVEYGEYQRNTDDGFKMLADGKVIKYVHELQHALRLCGLEKEIEL